MEEIRIQKYLADCGVASRRACEKDIAAGKVKVNGKVCEIGQKIIPGVDKVYYCGKLIKKLDDRKIYVMLNKPRGFVTTAQDELGRKCVIDLVKDIDTRIYPVGRLDKESEGLLLLTNDGDFANYMTHPKHEIPKIYHVKIKGSITPEQLKKLASPMDIDGYEILPVNIETVERTEESTVLRMELFEGRNRQIRKMCEALELEIIRLTRIAIGDLRLGNLHPGKWIYLKKSQIDYLMPKK